MPFQSDRQRRWMFANKPAMAKRWAREESLTSRVRKAKKRKKKKK